ncbi:hypothetical protein K4L44_04545 [Halosquirtibacter laminarini]|uniref:Uncharacterized protein n=1 Tax=Halosquirtibacter laminarini TaxID=3374600 RepID=A0AC61NHG2_9BACT|nr:hypothetical protein K4L44_04545 [Prolixibacteraceae bacterium]
MLSEKPNSIIIEPYSPYQEEDLCFFRIESTAMNGFGGVNRELHDMYVCKNTIQYLGFSDWIWTIVDID